MKFNRIKLTVIMALFGSTMLYGQATRTWVSGVGDDANPCSRTAPCKTFAGAISKTAAGGEIDALDPAGFGALTITKAITIDGGGGIVASVLVSGTNGIVVQAGANDVVILRNLMFNGISSGLNGIRFLSGKDLSIENCYIFGFTQNGIDVSLNQATPATVHVSRSVLKNNTGVGIRVTNAVLPLVQAAIDHTEIALDTIGVEGSNHSTIEINDSMISKASTSGIQSDSSTGDSIVAIERSEVINNASGATANSGSAVVTSDTKYAYNSGTALNQAGGTIFSYGTNRVHNNGTFGTSTPVSQQ